MEEFNNSPYTEDINQGVECSIRHSDGMARASKVCGIIAVVSVFTMMVYPAVIIGAVAIILSLLSRGAGSTLSSRAKTGLTTGIVAIAVNVLVLAGGAMLIFSDGPYKQELNEMSRQMYGQTFDDMMEDALDGKLDLDYHNLPIYME